MTLRKILLLLLLNGLVISLLAACGSAGGGNSGTSQSFSESSLGVSSASESSSSDKNASVAAIASDVKIGFLMDGPVANLSYSTDSLGLSSPLFTNAEGEFFYRENEQIVFRIGNWLFPSTLAQPTLTALDIAASSDPNQQQAKNINRLLLSLDTDGDAKNGLRLDTAALAHARAVDLNLNDEEFAAAIANLVANAGSPSGQVVDLARAQSHFQNTLATSVNDRVTLNAEPGDALDATATIRASFGSSAVEDQTCEGAHSAFDSHVNEVVDELRNKAVFEVAIHRDQDKDCSTNKTDRQRVELKTYASSQAKVKATPGEWTSYRWKFRLADGFQPSAHFTHIFQLKPVDGDDDTPIITLTPRKASPENRLELSYYQNTAAGARLLTSASLNLFTNKWVDAFVRVHHLDEQGYLEVTLRDNLTQQILLRYTNNAIDMFRDQASFNRPKWGIYRSIVSLSDLRDETIRFSDFCIAEASNTCLFVAD